MNGVISLPEIELIVEGEVQGVGYRQYVAKIGRRLKLVGFVKNLEDGTVEIHCKGDKKTISKFREIIERKNPPEAPLVDVEDIKEKELAEGTIKQTTFYEIYDEPSAEMSQGFSTGMGYMNLFREETQANFKHMDENLNLFREETHANLNLLRTDTQASFKHMDEKYADISKAMLAVVVSIEERNKTFEDRMEKTEKNIESLLKILAQKKG